MHTKTFDIDSYCLCKFSFMKKSSLQNGCTLLVKGQDRKRGPNNHDACYLSNVQMDLHMISL